MDLEETPKKLCFFIFNRATYSRTKILLHTLTRAGIFDVTVVLSNSLLLEEYGAAHEYISRSHPNVKFHILGVANENGTHIGSAHIASEIMLKASDYLSQNKFDAVVVIADRFETLPAAMAASYQNIPLIHIQGGEVTGNIDEKVRHSVTKLADYHFAATKLAKQYVIAMGEHQNRVYVTGCPSLDVINCAKLARHHSKERYIMCMFHPETEKPEEGYAQTEALLEAVIEFCKSNLARCYWYWPNPDPGRNEILKLLEVAHKKYNTVLIKAINKTPENFLMQLSRARFIIGNSSCTLRESSFMGVPAINVGDRQRLRERSWNVIDCGFNVEEIKDAMKRQDNAYKYAKSYLYGNGRSSEYILDTLKRIGKFELKPSLQYPYRPEYKEMHFGESRFSNHRQGAQRPNGRKQKGQEAISFED